MANPKTKKKGKVLVAMSGGIDSTLAAFLLKEQGFIVRGVFFQLPAFDSKIARQRANLAAQKIGIPLKILDLRKQFEEQVISYSLKNYKIGVTPNPCVICNQKIKFSNLIKEADRQGAEFIATGHYARLKRENNSEKVILLAAKDKNKDQSYFLWQLKQSQLRRTLFPIGDYSREEVKKITKEIGLNFGIEKGSQELCFVVGQIKSFLTERLGESKGKILTDGGKVVGEHTGLWFYTIGQRRGLGISGGPWYVVGKDLKNNILFVSKDKKKLKSKEMAVGKINWISGIEPKLPLLIKVKIRYNQTKKFCAVLKKQKQVGNNKSYLVVFKKLQSSITPGQSAVFYSTRDAYLAGSKASQVLGGGVILPPKEKTKQEARNNNRKS